MIKKNILKNLEEFTVKELRLAATCLGLKTGGVKGEVLGRLRRCMGGVCEADKSGRSPKKTLRSRIAEAIMRYKTEHRNVLKASDTTATSGVEIKSPIKPWKEISSVKVKCNGCLELKGEVYVSQGLCCFCRLSKFDPFQPMDGIIWYGFLKSGSENLGCYINCSDYLHDWKKSNKRVFIRCINLAHQDWGQQWPFSVSIIINMHTIKILAPKSGQKRREYPLDVTGLLKAAQNTITLRCKYANTDNFIATLVLCSTLTVEDIKNKIVKNTDLNTYDICRNRIIKLLNTKDEYEEVTCIKGDNILKLLCSISMERIVIPARGLYCRHINCFDLNNFLEVTRTTPAFHKKWQCVLCNSSLKPENIIVDTYVLHILNNCQANEVHIFKNGEWKEVVKEELSIEQNYNSVQLSDNDDEVIEISD